MPSKDIPDNEEAQWAYSPEDDATDERPRSRQKSVKWTASEFIDHHKGAGWYLAFIAGLAGLSALVYIFTKDYISSFVIVLAGVIFVVLARKKPQQMPYEINGQGVQIGDKFYQYGVFKSFGISQDGGIKYINLLPLKRFMPDISIYFPPEQETAIVDILGSHLPHDEHVEKTADKLAKKLRF